MGSSGRAGRYRRSVASENIMGIVKVALFYNKET